VKILIGFFKATDGWKAHTIVFHEVNGIQKTFGSYQEAEKYIAKHNLGQSASPVEVHEK
jgi:hypothetical protein